VSFDEDRFVDELIETAEWQPLGRADTVKDVEHTTDVRVLMEKIARGEEVEKTELVAQLERMLQLVARTDADFEALVIMVRRRSRLRPDGDVVELRTLADGSALIYTPWPVSSRRTLEEDLAAAHPGWLCEHDDPRGVPCFRASALDIATAALSYDDALYLLGEQASFLDT
jgi:hypothetical protein